MEHVARKKDGTEDLKILPQCSLPLTGVVVEPMLTDQWFVAMSKPGKDGKSITEQALECVASGEIKFHPENWA